jgi:hypothetical protein
MVVDARVQAHDPLADSPDVPAEPWLPPDLTAIWSTLSRTVNDLDAWSHQILAELGHRLEAAGRQHFESTAPSRLIHAGRCTSSLRTVARVRLRAHESSGPTPSALQQVRSRWGYLVIDGYRVSRFRARLPAGSPGKRRVLAASVPENVDTRVRDVLMPVVAAPYRPDAFLPWINRPWYRDALGAADAELAWPYREASGALRQALRLLMELAATGPARLPGESEVDALAAAVEHSLRRGHAPSGTPSCSGRLSPDLVARLDALPSGPSPNLSALSRSLAALTQQLWLEAEHVVGSYRPFAIRVLRIVAANAESVTGPAPASNPASELCVEPLVAPWRSACRIGWQVTTRPSSGPIAPPRPTAREIHYQKYRRVDGHDVPDRQLTPREFWESNPRAVPSQRDFPAGVPLEQRVLAVRFHARFVRPVHYRLRCLVALKDAIELLRLRLPPPSGVPAPP